MLTIASSLPFKRVGPRTVDSWPVLGDRSTTCPQIRWPWSARTRRSSMTATSKPFPFPPTSTQTHIAMGQSMPQPGALRTLAARLRQTRQCPRRGFYRLAAGRAGGRASTQSTVSSGLCYGTKMACREGLGQPCPPHDSTVRYAEACNSNEKCGRLWIPALGRGFCAPMVNRAIPMPENGSLAPAA